MENYVLDFFSHRILFTKRAVFLKIYFTKIFYASLSFFYSGFKNDSSKTQMFHRRIFLKKQMPLRAPEYAGAKGETEESAVKQSSSKCWQNLPFCHSKTKKRFMLFIFIIIKSKSHRTCPATDGEAAFTKFFVFFFHDANELFFRKTQNKFFKTGQL